MSCATMTGSIEARVSAQQPLSLYVPDRDALHISCPLRVSHLCGVVRSVNYLLTTHRAIRMRLLAKKNRELSYSRKTPQIACS
jgi:hypothetical protein